MTKNLKVSETNKPIGSWSGNKTIWQPKIQLAGVWLYNAGFNAGDIVKVEYFDGKIIISKDK